MKAFDSHFEQKQLQTRVMMGTLIHVLEHNDKSLRAFLFVFCEISFLLTKHKDPNSKKFILEQYKAGRLQIGSHSCLEFSGKYSCLGDISILTGL